nr:DUF1232 domain-containing protein [Fusibacter paucivorans]
MRAKQLKSDIPIVFLALKDKETPFLAKFFAGVVIVYALSPVDLIPDFIPVLGYLDDLILLPGLIALTLKLIPDDVMMRCRNDAQTNGIGRKKWYYALPFIAIWVVILTTAVRLLWR